MTERRYAIIDLDLEKMQKMDKDEGKKRKTGHKTRKILKMLARSETYKDEV